MITIKLNKSTGNYRIVGHFEFRISNATFDPETFLPKRTIHFDFSPEIAQDAKAILKISSKRFNEDFGELLKQDFIKFLEDVENGKV